MLKEKEEQASFEREAGTVHIWKRIQMKFLLWNQP